MGHPAPFHLKMMGVGNEQWGPQYIERYAIFTRAIKQKYPSIRLVNSVGPNPDGDLFNFLNDTLRSLHADILDEHYYRSPEWFLRHADRYDHYDRQGRRSMHSTPWTSRAPLARSKARQPGRGIA